MVESKDEIKSIGDYKPSAGGRGEAQKQLPQSLHQLLCSHQQEEIGYLPPLLLKGWLRRNMFVI
jgi:hypothetical protein